MISFLPICSPGWVPQLSRIERAKRATQWANGPIQWALRFQRHEGPFRPLRRVPLFVLAQLPYWHILLLKK